MTNTCNNNIIHLEIVEKVKKQMPEKESLQNLADFYKMFADRTRINILWSLSLNELCVCDIAYLLGMSKSAVSHQLKSLRLANLVKYRKDGKVVYYSLADEHIKSILEQAFIHFGCGS